jgi:hypothetical protein
MEDIKKKDQIELKGMKIITFEIKNTVDGIHSGLPISMGKISKLKDTAIEVFKMKHRN